jgi:hypothetical protein
MHLSRVRNDHAADKGGNCLDYGVGIACCLDHEVILRRQLGSERRKIDSMRDQTAIASPMCAVRVG